MESAKSIVAGTVSRGLTVGMSDIKFPVKIQMDGRVYIVDKIIHPKKGGESMAVAYSQTMLGRRKVQSPSTRVRLAGRVMEPVKFR